HFTGDVVRHLHAVLHLVFPEVHLDHGGLRLGSTGPAAAALGGVAARRGTLRRGTLRRVRGSGRAVAATLTGSRLTSARLRSARLTTALLAARALTTLAAATLTAAAARCGTGVGHHQRHVRLD